MKKLLQVTLISLLCLTSVTPAMAAGAVANGTGIGGQTGTMTGTGTGNVGGYGTGIGNNFGNNGYGTLDMDNDNRNGVRARNNNVRGFAAADAADGTDWGWLGLLGLLGLAGMFNRGRDRGKI